MQILLAVLARKYDWSVDLKEPLKTFPLPYPAWGLPMTFTKLSPEDISTPLKRPQIHDVLRHSIGQPSFNMEAFTPALTTPAYRVSC